MHATLLVLTVLLQQPMPYPHHQPGTWWTHWVWMLVWVVLAIGLVLVIARLLWPPRR